MASAHKEVLWEPGEGERFVPNGFLELLTFEMGLKDGKELAG